jgi:hypothetical protein
MASRGVETGAMLSWIFRHRQRLLIIYGSGTAPARAGGRFEHRPPPEEIAVAASARELRPGGIAWSGRHLWLRPLPPPAA